MSHTNVYKHFPSKIALQEAVAERWLEAISEPLAEIVSRRQRAPRKLEAWVLALAESKARQVREDPELFATYHALVEANGAVIAKHIDHLREHLGTIIRAGVATGEYFVDNPDRAAAAILTATAQFHHPAHVSAAGGVVDAADARRVIALLNAGLKTRVI
jgi:AcrR family transcriptional regulator